MKAAIASGQPLTCTNLYDVCLTTDKTDRHKIGSDPNLNLVYFSFDSAWAVISSRMDLGKDLILCFCRDNRRNSEKN